MQKMKSFCDFLTFFFKNSHELTRIDTKSLGFEGVFASFFQDEIIRELGDRGVRRRRTE